MNLKKWRKKKGITAKRTAELFMMKLRGVQDAEKRDIREEQLVRLMEYGDIALARTRERAQELAAKLWDKNNSK